MSLPTITTFQQLFVLLLSPLVLAFIGDTTAAILKQDGFDKYSPIWNELIAWAVVLVFALLSVVADNQFNGGLNAVADATIAAFSLLASGSLKSLKYWLIFTGWVQAATNFVQAPAQIAPQAPVAPPDPVVEAWQQAIDKSVVPISQTKSTNAVSPSPLSLPSKPQPKPITLMSTQPNPITPATDEDHSG